MAIQFNDGYTETIISFVNSIPTRGGGTHETGFKTAFTRVMNEYARKTGLLKEKDKNLDGVELREGMMAVVNIKMSDVEFVGQTKDQLGSAEARSAVDAVVSDQMAVFPGGKSANRANADEEGGASVQGAGSGAQSAGRSAQRQEGKESKLEPKRQVNPSAIEGFYAQ